MKLTSLLMSLKKITAKNSFQFFFKSHFNLGFTLVEVLIVLAIIGAVISIGIPRLMKSDGNIKKVVRTFGVLGKQIKSNAKLFNKSYRLVFRLDSSNQAYWVEASQDQRINLKKIAEIEKERKDRGGSEDSPASPFNIDTSFFKKEQKLPRGIKFVSVETQNTDGPKTEGLVYIYFSPEGLTEASAIQVGNEKFTWTFAYNPLTAQLDVIDSAKSLKDLER